MKYQDITGNRYGSLVAIKRIENNLQKHTRWLFRCDCGNEHAANTADVKAGKTRSCGCASIESSKKNIENAHKRNTKHGMSFSNIYRVWYGTKGRCCTKSSTGYPRYGAVGITMCDEWMNDPQSFIDWAMANGYKKGLSIDRIDGTKGYSPENCRWATRAEQSRNLKSNVRITLNGRTEIVADWARITGINFMTIMCRIKRGLPPEEVLSCVKVRSKTKSR